MIKQYGLIGKSLVHSFSLEYFRQKFADENINDAVYTLFPLDSIHLFQHIIYKHPHLMGLNVTTPYKEEILEYADYIDEIVYKVRATNVLKIKSIENKTIISAYNTDVLGFEHTMRKLSFQKPIFALILGTGGTAKAVAYVLTSMNISFTFVSRKSGDNTVSYNKVNSDLISKHSLIVNCTPLGMYPMVHTFPLIPYEAIGKNHILIDLIYNPSETLFLRKGKKRGAYILNGYDMFCEQAEQSWKIWNNS